MQGVSEIGLKLNLPPPFTDGLSLLAGSALNAYFDPTLTLRQSVTLIAPQVSQKLTLGGMDLLGRSLGWDARISRLLGLPFSAAVGQIVDNLTGLGGFGNPRDIFNVVRNSFLAGAVSIGAEFIVDKLGLDESLGTSLASRFGLGIIKDFLLSSGKVDVFESLSNSGKDLFQQLINPFTLPQLYAAVAEEGLAAGFERYAIPILRRETIEEFTSLGMTFAQLITNALPNAQDGVFNGEQVKILQLSQNGKVLRLIFREVDGRLEVIAIHEITQNEERLTQWEVDGEGRLIKGFVEYKHADGTKTIQTLGPGGIRMLEFTDWEGEVFGSIQIHNDGTLEFRNHTIDVTGTLSSSGELKFEFGSPDLQDFRALVDQFNTANLTSGQKAEVVVFFMGNGFWNKRAAEDYAPQLSIDFMNNLIEDQSAQGNPPIVLLRENGSIALDQAGNVLTTASLPLTLYEETSLIGNALKWACEAWFGCDSLSNELSQELTDYFSLIQLNIERYGLDPNNVNFIHFSHSGNFEPMIKALEKNPDIPIKTFISYEGPYVGDGIIDNYNLETIIRVQGTRGLLEGDFGPSFLGFPDFKGIDQEGNLRDITEYNIEILGAGHSDFTEQNNAKVNLFMRELSQVASLGGDRLETFLNGGRAGISFDFARNVYIIDPDVFQSDIEV